MIVDSSKCYYNVLIGKISQYHPHPFGFAQDGPNPRQGGRRTASAFSTLMGREHIMIVDSSKCYYNVLIGKIFWACSKDVNCQTYHQAKERG
jgi:hypothetical protein